MPPEWAALAAIISAFGPFGYAAAGFWANQKGWLVSGRELANAMERAERLEEVNALLRDRIDTMLQENRATMERLTEAVLEGMKEKS